MWNVETQKSWGWIIAVYIFSAGIGGGAFLISYVFHMLNMFESVAKICSLVGPLLVLLGTLFLLADLGTVKNSFRLFTSPANLKTSWIARGAWLLSAFIILGLAYSLPSFGPFQWLPWSNLNVAGQGIGALAALLSIIVMIYPGLLFGVLRSIPFWNNSSLPLLFFLSGLDTGIGLIILVSLLGGGGSDMDFQLMGKVDFILMPLVLLTLGIYIYIAWQSGVAGAYSIRSLKNSVFILGVLVIGIVLPLAILLYSAFASNDAAIRLLSGIAAGFSLIGGLCLRYSVIQAGVNRSEVEI